MSKKRVFWITVINLIFLFASFVPAECLIPIHNMMVSAASSNNESVKISIQNEPSHIMDVNDAGFDIEMTMAASEGINYTIEYTLDGELFTDTLQVKPKAAAKKKIKFKNPKKGAYKLGITVKNGEEVIKKTESQIGIIEYYKPQFLDQYARYGMCMHYSMGDQSSQRDMELLQLAGCKDIRDEIPWSEGESEKGQYNFGQADNNLKIISDGQMNMIWIIDYGNTNYVKVPPNGLNPWMWPPRQKNEFDGLVNYTKAVLKKYPQIKTIEIWNEANGPTFWQPKPNAFEYAQMVKAVSMAVREVNPGIKIVGLALAIFDAKNYGLDVLKDNTYGYMDAISFHPYCQPATADGGTQKMIQMYSSVEDQNGGWKDYYATEVGWPTAKGITLDTQAEGIIKYLVYADQEGIAKSYWYNFRNKGDDKDDPEHNFGIIMRDYTPKPAYAVYSQVNKRLNGSIYLGEYDAGKNIKASMYMKDGKPMLIAWSLIGSGEFAADHISVEDMFGNNIPVSGSVTLDSKPKYIFGLSNEYFVKTAQYNINKAYGEWMDKWESVFSDTKEMKELKNAADALTSMPTETEVRSIMEKHYATGRKIIEAQKEKQLNVKPEEFMFMLYKFHKIGMMWGNLYAEAAASGEGQITSDQSLKTVSEKINGKLKVANHAQMKYSEELLRQTRNFNKLANEIKSIPGVNQVKNGLVKMNNALSDELASWASDMSEFEQVDENAAVLVYPNSSDMTLFQGLAIDNKIVVDNKRGKDINNATACVYDNENKMIWESPKFTVKSNQFLTVPIKVPTALNHLKGKFDYKIVIEENEKFVTEKYIKAEVKGIVQAQLLPVTTGLSSMRKLLIRLENVSEQSVNVKISVDPPKGWQFKQKDQEAIMVSKETKDIAFDITKKEKAPFNEYVFNINIVDNNGTSLYSQKVPLDFLIATENQDKISVPDFNGDITDWADAYPIHVHTPENPVKDEWESSTAAERVFVKWDSEKFYILADVYDDIHIQNYTDVMIWKGDSIQLAIDTKNDKAASYQADDYEYAFALTKVGENVFAHQAGSKDGGARPAEWLKVLRDENKKITRYLACIPKEDMPPVALEQGQKIGLNICVNDGDVFDRDKYFAFSSGLTEGKDPSQFKTWTLVKAEAPAATIDNSNFEVTINSKEMPKAPAFSDLLGHWAKDDVEYMSAMNIVQGKAENLFAPEDNITRAEFVAMVARGIKLDAKEYKNAFADVNAKDWYAGILQAAFDNGIIPEAMNDGGYKPNRFITREEMTGIMILANSKLKGVKQEVGVLDSFKDHDEISEWAKQFVALAYDKGYIKGKSADTFAPKENATRAEAVTIIKRMLASM